MEQPVEQDKLALLTKDFVKLDEPKLPPKYYKLKDLKDSDSSNVEKSGHEVLRVELPDGRFGYFKKCSEEHYYPAKLAKIEAAISAVYRLYLGERAADVVLVYDENNKVCGVVSIEIPDFTPIHQEKELTKEELIKCNIAALLFVSFFLQEDDLHPGNLSKKYRFDYDMSLYVLTHIIKGSRYVEGILKKLAAKSFDITAEDIRYFPVLSSVEPCFWVTYFPKNLNWQKKYEAQDEFIALSIDPQFIKQKFEISLQILLSDENMIKNAMCQRVSEDEVWIDGGPLLDKMMGIISTQLDTMRKALHNMPEFKEFLDKNPQCGDDIIKWYTEEYNKKIAADSPVEAKDLRKNYDDVLNYDIQQLLDAWMSDLTKEVGQQVLKKEVPSATGFQLFTSFFFTSANKDIIQEEPKDSIETRQQLVRSFAGRIAASTLKFYKGQCNEKECYQKIETVLATLSFSLKDLWDDDLDKHIKKDEILRSIKNIIGHKGSSAQVTINQDQWQLELMRKKPDISDDEFTIILSDRERGLLAKHLHQGLSTPNYKAAVQKSIMDFLINKIVSCGPDTDKYRIVKKVFKVGALPWLIEYITIQEWTEQHAALMQYLISSLLVSDLNPAQELQQIKNKLISGEFSMMQDTRAIGEELCKVQDEVIKTNSIIDGFHDMAADNSGQNLISTM